MNDVRTQRDRALFLLEHEKSPRVRADAAADLCELASTGEDPDELSPAVARLLTDRQEEVRCSGVALAAMTLPIDEARTVLLRHLKDRSERIRVEAVGQLADLGDSTTRGALADAMRDDSFQVRFEAARGMATLKHSAGIDVLIEALENDQLRFRALGALGELGDSDAVPAVRRLFRKWLLPAFERTQAAGVLATFGDHDAAAHLYKRARAKWGLDRSMAIELLGDVKAAGAFEFLTELLADEADLCRGPAALALGRLGDERGVELLSQLIANASISDELRLDAAEGLCLFGTEDAVGFVSQALSVATSKELRDELQHLLESAAGEDHGADRRALPSGAR